MTEQEEGGDSSSTQRSERGNDKGSSVDNPVNGGGEPPKIGELPTTAKVELDNNGYPIAEVTDYGYHLISGDELVRRKDVEQLIKSIFEDSFEPNLKGEAKELRAGGEPADTADMLEYFAEHFKEELLEEVQNQ